MDTKLHAKALSRPNPQNGVSLLFLEREGPMQHFTSYNHNQQHTNCHTQRRWVGPHQKTLVSWIFIDLFILLLTCDMLYSIAKNHRTSPGFKTKRRKTDL